MTHFQSEVTQKPFLRNNQAIRQVRSNFSSSLNRQCYSQSVRGKVTQTSAQALRQIDGLFLLGGIRQVRIDAMMQCLVANTSEATVNQVCKNKIHLVFVRLERCVISVICILSCTPDLSHGLGQALCRRQCLCWRCDTRAQFDYLDINHLQMARSRCC